MMNTHATFTQIHRKLNGAKIVVSLIDPLQSGGKTFGSVGMDIQPGDGVEPVKTPGGRFAYYHLPDGVYSMSVNATYYLNKKCEFAFPDDLPAEGASLSIDEDCTLNNTRGVPELLIRLQPSPDYPFVAGSTLLRVQVFVGDPQLNDTVEGAKVYVVKKNGIIQEEMYLGCTDSGGQATICCNRMTRDQILQMNGIEYNGSKTVTLVAVDSISNKKATATRDIKEFWQTAFTLSLPEN